MIWKEVLIDELKADDKSSIAIGPFGSRMKSDTYVESGVPVVRGTNITDTKELSDDLVYISADFADQLKAQNVTTGDLVFPHRGAIGEVGIVGRKHGRYVLSTSMMKLTCKETIVTPLFLFYFFRSPVGKHELLRHSSTVGTPGIVTPLTSLKSIRVNLPPLRTQRKIAGILSAYDDLIENNARRIAVLEEMAQSIYREWFVHFRFPGHEQAKFIDSPLGKIPEGWEVVQLDSLKSDERYAINGGPFGSKLGTKDYVPEGVPVIRGTNLTTTGGFSEDGFVFVSDEKAVELRANSARPGDIIVTQRGTLGQIGRIPRDCLYSTYVISQSQMKVSIHAEKANGVYVYYFLRSDESATRIKNLASSSGVPHINLGTLREFECLLPPKSLQERFGEFAEVIETAVTAYSKKTSNLRNTRDLLLPKLISGQLDVEALDIDIGEPVREAVA